MASLDELINTCQQAIDQIDQAISAVTAGENEAEEIQGQFAALSAEAQVAALREIKDGLQSWRVQLQGAVDTGNQVIEQTQAAKG